jgi:biopolymer transport protein ExbD
MARARQDLFPGTKPGLNMSSMIDLVFLLLIFFMVASKMITVRTIEGVEIPVASAAKVPRNAQGRIVVNVTRDGRILDADGSRELTPFDVQGIMSRAREQNPQTRLHLRTDHGASHGKVQEVLRASARGGVTDVVFSTYQTP